MEDNEGVAVENENEGGDITKLVQDVGAGLQKLSQVLDGSQGVTEEDRAQMAQVMSGFVDLVEKRLGNTQPGQNPEEEEMPMQKAVPAEGGLKGVPMGPQGKM